MTKYPNDTVPEHVAIIMDGNGRWANGRGFKRIIGHRKGVDAVKVAVESARDAGVGYLSLFAFSSENWKRPKDEVDSLMGLITVFIRRELANYHRQNIRFRMIGDKSGLSDVVVSALDDAEEMTRNNTGLTVIVAVNYGGRAEIARAVKAIAEDVAAGRLKAEDVGEDAIAARLDTFGIPDPDLIIRTSGEQRLSNFMLWQAAYSEFLFLPCLWPDFSRETFLSALETYARRDRRFGSVVEQAALTGI
ncbi:isoprenyl transferase [Martelella alba]|uniref:Isoprenyl transferase n=1 Tax=Martelella alba TaxID=2590451 RepID=A0A506UI79_9HYPH|nr:isoprenyl transferase [Martelella alba]TPW33027.1 isoprenyl transferase [Martelella alba]